MFLCSVHWEVFVIVCHEESALVCDMCLHVLEITIHKSQIAAGHQILPSSRVELLKFVDLATTLHCTMAASQKPASRLAFAHVPVLGSCVI